MKAKIAQVVIFLSTKLNNVWEDRPAPLLKSVRMATQIVDMN